MNKQMPSSKRRTNTARRAAERPTDSHKRILAAASRAVREALKAHKAEGHSIVIWRDGKVVKVPAREIDI